MIESGRHAIITTFTPNFWDDFIVFYNSIKLQSTTTIIVIPLEFTQDDLNKLLEYDVLILRLHEQEIKDYQKLGPRWMQWFKPALIKKAITTYYLDIVLWLDVDLVVLNSLRPLFQKTAETFWVINDYFAPESCRNDPRLYDEYPSPVPKEQENTVLNSGVLGIGWPRDKPIIDMWLEKIQLISDNQHLVNLVSLYDQGALIWALRDLKLIDKILSIPEWNYAAIKNGYESDRDNPQWPNCSDESTICMGGDIIDEIKYDNPNAIIAHFAGLPKLRHLCQTDSPEAKQYRHHRYRSKQPNRVFIVGLERAGTHSIAEIIRRSSKTESWVRHEFQPVLAQEAQAKWQNLEYDESTFQNRMKLFNRLDVQFVVESNHRLGFFIPEIKQAVPDAKFIFLLRNPINLIISRLLSFCCWPALLHKFPGHYQLDVFELHAKFKNGSADQNKYRIESDIIHDLPPAQMHEWEVANTLQHILQDLRKLPENNYAIIWIEDQQELQSQIEKLIPGQIFWQEAQRWLKTRFGARIECSAETTQWVHEHVNNYANDISHNITSIFKKFDVPFCDRILL